MATHIHEEEQVEALKRWWKANGSSVIGGIILGLAAIFGWNTWQKYQRNQAEQAANLYSQLQNALEERKYDLAEGLAQRLTGDYGKTAYADFARLYQAKLAMEQGKLEEAKKSLGMLLTTSHDFSYRHIARLRLARVLLAMGNPTDGLEILNSPEAGEMGRFAGQYAEIEGDLYVALGKPEEAAKAYRKAMKTGRNHLYLQMKLNDLGQDSSDRS